MSKLQQLKAYQPPKLDYLAQMKRNGGQPQRSSLISADASNIHNNPRLIGMQANDRQSSINRNDPNRDSLQSRLIERIHSKKMNNKKVRSDSKIDDKSTERRVKPQQSSEKKAQEEPIDEIGIQADDEDNDQIETERAHNPGQDEMQKYQQVVAAAKHVPIQLYGY